VLLVYCLQVQIMLDNLRELGQGSSLPPLFVSSVLALFMQTTGGLAHTCRTSGE
jgi:hypothetical protein